MISATIEATGRTKSRIGMHHKHGILMPDGDPRVLDIFQGELCQMFRCSECDWLGWFPMNEVIND